MLSVEPDFLFASVRYHLVHFSGGRACLLPAGPQRVCLGLRQAEQPRPSIAEVLAVDEGRDIAIATIRGPGSGQHQPIPAAAVQAYVERGQKEHVSIRSSLLKSASNE